MTHRRRRALNRLRRLASKPRAEDLGARQLGMGTEQGIDGQAEGLAREVGRLQHDSRNLTTALELEVLWKDLQRPYIQDLLNGGEQARALCGGQLIDFCSRFLAQHGRRPQVLDFACGPITSIAHLHHAGLAEVTGVDALADEYNALFRRHGVENPIPPQPGIGEYLAEQYAGRQFDLVHVRNALDHTQVPAVVWLNLFQLTRIGGVLAHSHSIREAEKNEYKQLHRFNLYPMGMSVWISERDGHDFSLTDHLPLRRRWFSSTREGEGWMASGHEKTGSDPEPDIYRHALDQAVRAFAARSRWAFELEGFAARVRRQLAPGTVAPPVSVSSDRA